MCLVYTFHEVSPLYDTNSCVMSCHVMSYPIASHYVYHTISQAASQPKKKNKNRPRLTTSSSSPRSIQQTDSTTCCTAVRQYAYHTQPPPIRSLPWGTAVTLKNLKSSIIITYVTYITIHRVKSRRCPSFPLHSQPFEPRSPSGKRWPPLHSWSPPTHPSYPCRIMI